MAKRHETSSNKGQSDRSDHGPAGKSCGWEQQGAMTKAPISRGHRRREQDQQEASATPPLIV